MAIQSETPLGTEIKNGTADTITDADNMAFERSGIASPFRITYLAFKNLLALIFAPFKFSELTTADGATTTGVNITFSTSFLVPANTFSVGDLIGLEARGFKTGANGTFTTRIYVNTTNSISGATLLATFASASNGNSMLTMTRNAPVKSSSVTQFVSASGNLATDYIQAATSNININHTINQYYIVALQCGNAADSSLCSFFNIWKH